MPAERAATQKVREILRLKRGAGMPHKAIVRNLGIAASTVRMTVGRAAAAGLTSPLPDDLSDVALENKLRQRVKARYTECREFRSFDLSP